MLRIVYLILAVICALCSAKDSLSRCVVNRRTCLNAFTAYECGLLHECIKEWLTYPWSQYQNDTSVDCRYCQYISASVLGDKMKLFCLLHPNKYECSAVVKELSKLEKLKYKDEIFCNILAVCNSHSYVKDLNFGSPICDDCKRIFSDVQKFVLDNATEDAILNQLYTLCSSFPDQLIPFCKETIKASLPSLIHLVAEELDPATVCNVVGLCDSQVDMTLADFMGSKVKRCYKEPKFSWINRPNVPGNHKWTSYRKLGVPRCSDCRAVLEQIKTALSDKSTMETLKKLAINEICPLMSVLEEQCKRAIQYKFDEILDVLLNLEIDKVCTLFGMCSTIKDRSQDLVKIPIPGVCEFCELMMHKLFDMFAANRTEESILYTLNALCESFPDRYRQSCFRLVQQYGVEIVKAVIEGTAPKVICAAMGVCFTKPSQESFTHIVKYSSGFDVCTTCKFFVDTIYTQVKNNKTEEEIKHALSEVCMLLPAGYSAECDDLINKYLDDVISYIEKSYTPEQACQAIALCPSTHLPSLSEQNPCLLGYSYWCRDPNTAKLCNAEKFCDSIGWTLFPLSNQNLAFKTPCEIMNLSAICVNFEMAKKCDRVSDCMRKQIERFSNKFDVSSVISSTNENCVVCATILARWKLQWDILGGPITIGDICESYSGKQLEQCRQVLEKQTDLLEQASSKQFNSSKICSKIIQCDKQSANLQTESNNVNEDLVIKRTQTILGLNPCTWGPLYFCKSEQLAEECGMNFVKDCNGRYRGFAQKPDEPRKPIDSAYRPGPPF